MDNDLETFLKEKAVLFEKLGKSRTFFVFSTENNKFDLLGYFTIALSILRIPEEFSKRKIKQLDGFSSKINNQKLKEIPGILIGQLGKNTGSFMTVKGDDLIAHCLAAVYQGQQYIGGRIIILECKNNNYLKNFYKKHGFNLLDKKYKGDELLVFSKIIDEKDLLSL